MPHRASDRQSLRPGVSAPQRQILTIRRWRFLAMALFSAVCLNANAERADSDQPVNVEADSVEIDDQKQEAVFVGNVVLTQGTLMLKADRIIVKQGENGFQSGIATGKPAYFRQKREGSDDFIEGQAERLEYDGEAEKVEMFSNAKLNRGGDEITGNYISYNALTEFFEVKGGGSNAGTPGSPPGRVRAVIQPRNSDGDSSSQSTPESSGDDGANR